MKILFGIIIGFAGIWWFFPTKDDICERLYDGRYTEEQAERHQAMKVPYSELSRDDQIKDLYIAYKLDKEWFVKQTGHKEVFAEFPRVITWETVT